MPCGWAEVTLSPMKLRSSAKAELIRAVPLFSGCSRRELAAIAAMPDVKEALEQQGLVPAYWDAQKTGAHVRAEVERWRAVVEKAGLQPK